MRFDIYEYMTAKEVAEKWGFLGEEFRFYVLKEELPEQRIMLLFGLF